MGDLVVYGGSGAGRDTSNALAVVSEEKQLEAQQQRIKEAEELEAKLKKITDEPTKIYNTMGSSAGAGSGDFHMYRLVRRAEQMRQKALDEDWQARQEKEAFEAKRKAAQDEIEERSAKRRAKRLKKKAKKKKPKTNADGTAAGDGGSSSDDSNGKGVEQAELD